MNDAGDEPIPDDDVVITVPADQQAGVWSNWAAINESDNTFRESRPNGQAAADLMGEALLQRAKDLWPYGWRRSAGSLSRRYNRVGSAMSAMMMRSETRSWEGVVRGDRLWCDRRRRAGPCWSPRKQQVA